MTSFTITATLNLPGDTSLPASPIPVSFSSAFASEADLVLNLTGAGTQVVPFGSIDAPGLKALLIKVDPSSTASPVSVIFNGGDEGVEVSPGGFILYGNPVPVDGVVSLSVVYTTPCVVRVWALG